jgi:hypothetical protein
MTAFDDGYCRDVQAMGEIEVFEEPRRRQSSSRVRAAPAGLLLLSDLRVI